MVYSGQMRDLMPPRTVPVTLAAVLAIITGLIGLAATTGLLVLVNGPDVEYRGVRLKQLAMLVLLGCGSVAAVIGGFGILFRRNWGRILAVSAAGPLIFEGLWDLYGLRGLLPSLVRSDLIARLFPVLVLPLLAAIAWLMLLIGKKVRAEFLPPAMVEIYVNLLNEGTPCKRPTLAFTMGNGLFELLPAEGYDPQVEQWEFRPGSIVRGKEERRDGEAYLLATSFGR
jgi:hypothetical protein